MLAQLLGPTQVIDHSDDLEVPVGVFFAQSLDALETGIVAVRVPEIKHCKLLPRKDRLVDGISVQIRRFERKIEFIEAEVLVRSCLVVLFGQGFELLFGERPFIFVHVIGIHHGVLVAARGCF